MGILSSLTRPQKEAIGLLQIGTFLEYFDLMLYVHMAVLLNELFFPKTDPHTAALITAFAFCSTYVLRPFGALLFGYIGDQIGRRSTVILTTMMMAVSCIIMANLPTYAQVGITATWIVTLCRVIQGLSSMGEIMGSQIYVTEMTSPPVQYPAVAFIGIATFVGGAAALGVATLVTRAGFNWRLAFWVGATIALVGSVARTRLRETPEFIDAKRRLLQKIEASRIEKVAKIFERHKIKNLAERESINYKTLLGCFFIYCGWPLCFYMVYMYFIPLLKKYGYSSEDIIFHNFLLSLIIISSEFIVAFLSYKIHPLKILQVRGIAFLLYILTLPFLIEISSCPIHIFLLQTFLLVIPIQSLPAEPIFIKHFPIFKRVTATSILYAISRALVYIVTSFGLVYLTEWFGYFGVWFIAIPAIVSFLWGVKHFERLESDSGKHSTGKVPWSLESI